MQPIAFWLYTTLAGVVFAYAFLWSMAQWLKADAEVEEFEREMAPRLVEEGLRA